MRTQSFITLDQVTVRLGGAWPLHKVSWEMRCGENWVIWGANGAGKTTLAKALLGEAQVVQGKIQRHYQKAAPVREGQIDMAFVSADQQFDLFRRELMLEQMRHFSGQINDVTRAAAVWTTLPDFDNDCAKLLRVESLLAKPLHALSAGEMRRLLIGSALMQDPRLLILDEPFNGLDADTRDELMPILNQLAGTGTQMVLITHRPAEIPKAFTHLLHLDQGRAVWRGTMDQFTPSFETSPADADRPLAVSNRRQSQRGAPIIEMRGVNVAYGEEKVLSDIRWTVHRGENWALVGPNGAGKSTLLKLITGDNLQGYANDLILFGRPKGSGESVWDIKQQIGYVADDLQIRYQKKMKGFDVVCSGFFDSVGLYRHCTPGQKAAARQWFERTGIVQLASRLFCRLSFGQQRMLLIVRAMVKKPPLLILDEPCNGLDVAHRRQLLDILDVIGSSGHTNLLYVSHRPDEMPCCITHRFHLSEGRQVAKI